MAGTIRIQALTENLVPTIDTVFPSETDGDLSEVTKKLNLGTLKSFIQQDSIQSQASTGWQRITNIERNIATGELRFTYIE